MNLRRFSYRVQNPEDSIYLIQNVRRWYDAVDLHRILTDYRVPTASFTSVTEWILRDELFEVYALPIRLRNEFAATSKRVTLEVVLDGVAVNVGRNDLNRMLHNRLQNIHRGELNELSRRWLYTPPPPNSAEISMWLSGFDLYMEYQLDRGN